jgi:ABC-type bacteriocin/lantibiotic exporter with double-glycine peptidase domain
MKSYLVKIGKIKIDSNDKRFKYAYEAFDAIKEIKTYGIESRYIKLFGDNAYNYAKFQAQSNSLIQIPRFFLEGVAFSIVLIYILFYMVLNGTITEIVPVILVYAYAGYRLMPAVQNIFSNISMIKYSEEVFDKVLNIYEEMNEYTRKKEVSIINEINNINKIDIIMENIHYIYPANETKVIENFNLEIKEGSKIGIVGKTGSGKSTISDLIMGILKPSNGIIKIDGVNVTDEDKITNLNNLISFVPQNIFISNSSIKENIAFGHNKENIDYEKVKKVAQLANIHEFIEEMEHGYDTVLGEKGIRLSGGQRQRIAIARALYRDPQLLLLDEATSALDNITENILIETINKLPKKLTIIIIAHRLSTVKDCDMIVMMECGKIIAKGTFSELIHNSKEFKEMLNA